VVAFVGRIQPLKAPDILLRAAAGLPPDLRDQVTIAIVGGNSGSGLDLSSLAAELGVAGVVRFLPPQDRQALPDVYRAADLVAVPSYNESFGLVALEAQACGTPVVAAAVGGLPTAVRDGRSGVLVDGHDPADWARVLARLLREPGLRAVLSQGAIEHARQFSWNQSAASLLAVYRDAVTEYRSHGFELATAR
jgi:D-inositol-3-phosphate glycosyltransferase